MYARLKLYQFIRQTKTADSQLNQKQISKQSCVCSKGKVLFRSILIMTAYIKRLPTAMKIFRAMYLFAFVFPDRNKICNLLKYASHCLTFVKLICMPLGFSYIHKLKYAVEYYLKYHKPSEQHWKRYSNENR